MSKSAINAQSVLYMNVPMRKDPVNMSSRDTAATLAKGLAVLDCFASGRTDLTMAEIARLTALERATARRLCLTLEQSGYLFRRDKTFQLTPKVMTVAGGYLTSQGIGRSVQPVLNQFAEELEGEIALALRDGDQAVYIARSAVSTARLTLGLSVGSTLPLLPTAVGRMILARCSAETQDRLITDAPLERWTEHTTLDRASIREAVQEAARLGYAHTAAEFETGAAGVAVPIPPISGAEAVLATTASTNRFARDGELDRVLDILRRAAMSLRA